MTAPTTRPTPASAPTSAPSRRRARWWARPAAALLAALALLTAGPAAARMVELQGVVWWPSGYRVEPGAAMVVALVSTTRGADRPTTLALQRLVPATLPTDFRLLFDDGIARRSGAYKLVARLEDRTGALQLETEMTVFLDPNRDPARFELRLENPIRRPRAVSLLGQSFAALTLLGEPPAGFTAPHIDMAHDGQLTGSTGCNSFSGKHLLAAETLRFVELSVRPGGCTPVARETEKRVLRVLRGTRRWEYRGTRLTLRDDADRTLAVFQRRR